MVSKHKRYATVFIVFKFASFISIVFYWRITQDVEDTKWHYNLLPDVKCPSLATLPSNWPRQTAKSIYFVETSERINPNFLLMCSVESAARIHPESRIIILIKALVTHNNTLPKHMGMSLLQCFPNVEIKPLDLNDLFSDTPLIDWYKVRQQKWEPFRLPILSDASRIAIMWKYGGIYLDTDFIVLKNLNNLTNVLGIQSKYLLNGAFLSFEAKHKFIQLCLQDFVDHYNAWIWGHQGPQLFTRMFKRWCSIRSLQSRRNCKGVSILPQEAFYPIRWQDWMTYFEETSASELPRLIKDTYAAHVWNKKSQEMKHKMTPKSLLGQLHLHYCPSTYRLMKVTP